LSCPVAYVTRYHAAAAIDSETTYEIIRAMKLYCSIFGTTVVISLLQPTPEVFYTFDDLMLLGK